MTWSYLWGREAFADQETAFAHFPVAIAFFSTAQPGDDSALGQALEVKGYVETIGMERPAQLFPVRQGFQPLLVDIDDFVDIRFPRQDRRELFMDGPDDAGVRAVLAQCVECRQGVKDVARELILMTSMFLYAFTALPFCDDGPDEIVQPAASK